MTVEPEHWPISVGDYDGILVNNWFQNVGDRAGNSLVWSFGGSPTLLGQSVPRGLDIEIRSQDISSSDIVALINREKARLSVGGRWA